MIGVALIVSISLMTVTSIGLVFLNALLITQLRREHQEIYESIGSPRWLWAEVGASNSAMCFVFGSQWKSMNDSFLVKLCWLSRMVYVVHFSIATIAILTFISAMFIWAVYTAALPTTPTSPV